MRFEPTSAGSAVATHEDPSGPGAVPPRTTRSHSLRTDGEEPPGHDGLALAQRLADAHPGTHRVAWAERLAGHHPARAAATVVVAAWAAVTAMLVASGLLITHVLADTPVGRWDESVNRWLVDRRTGWLDTVTSAATFIANTTPVVVLALVVAVIALVRRRWPVALLLASGLLVEITGFLVTSFSVDRPRPNVLRLDSTPSTASFPSGHIAATLVLWLSIALAVRALSGSRGLRALAWAVAVILPVVVGFARVYRGMHHPLDVLAGALLGLAAVAAARACTLAAATAHARRRSTATASSLATEPLRPEPARLRSVTQ